MNILGAQLKMNLRDLEKAQEKDKIRNRFCQVEKANTQ